MKYDIAAVVITYNSSKYLRDAIDSLIQTKFKGKFLVYFSDDASSDSTVDIIKDYKKKYPDLVDYRINPKNLGIGGNLFTAYEIVDAKYIFPVAGDDLHPNVDFLQKNFEIMEANPHLSMSYFSGMKFYENDLTTLHEDICIPPKNEFDLDFWIANGSFSVTVHSMLIRKASLPVKFDTWMLTAEHEDWVLLIMLLKAGNVRFTHESATYYRMHSQGITAKGHSSKEVRGTIETTKNLNAYTNYQYKHVFGDLGWLYERLSYTFIREKRYGPAIISSLQFVFGFKNSFLDVKKFLKTWARFLFKGIKPEP